MKGLDPFRIIQEPISNFFDESSATVGEITVELSKDEIHKGKIHVRIHDNGSGFARLRDVYTLFGHSIRANDPEKRGRFDLGEKQFVAMADQAIVETTDKRFVFNEDSRGVSDFKTEGTTVEGWFDLPLKAEAEILSKLQLIKVPKGKRLVINGHVLEPEKSIRTFEATLTTVQPQKSDSHILLHVNRRTTVSLYQPNNREPWLFEMGIPVQPIENLWDIDIGQKIPLNPNRDTVSDAWLKRLYVAVVNNAHDLIPKDQAGKDFVTVGLSGSNAEAAKAILEKRFETTNVLLRSTDYHANEAAMEDGAFVIPQGVFDTETRKHLRDIGVTNYASEVYDTSFVGSKAFEPSPVMLRFEKFVNEIAKATIGKEVTCDFIIARDTNVIAQYSNGVLTFNVGHSNIRRRDSWFEYPTVENIGVVIHELAHDKEGAGNGIAHLSGDFVKEVERVAAIVAIKGIEYFWSMSS